MVFMNFQLQNRNNIIIYVTGISCTETLRKFTPTKSSENTAPGITSK